MSKVDQPGCRETAATFTRRPDGSRVRRAIKGGRRPLNDAMRGLIRAVEEQPNVERALGPSVARNTLSNALAERDPEQMLLSAWDVSVAGWPGVLLRMISEHYNESIGDCRRRSP